MMRKPPRGKDKTRYPSREPGRGRTPAKGPLREGRVPSKGASAAKKAAKPKQTISKAGSKPTGGGKGPKAMKQRLRLKPQRGGR